MAKVWEGMADSGINYWNDAVGWRYDAMGKLPAKERFLAKRYELLGQIARIDDMAKSIYRTFRAASETDQVEIYKYLTTQGARPLDIVDRDSRRKAIDVKRQFDAVGRQLVDRGLLLQESFDKYEDRYLPRIYLKYILGKKKVRKLAGGKKVSNMGWSRARDETLHPDIREHLYGEITDPGFLAAKGLGTEMRDMAILDFLQHISTQKEWVHKDTVVNWDGRKVSAVWLDRQMKELERQAAYYDDAARIRTLNFIGRMRAVLADATPIGKTPVDSNDYEQVPDSRQYGRLRGMWVRKEIYRDLIEVGQTMPGNPDFWADWFGYGGKGTKVTQLWKLMKVAMNPPAQIRNAASNMVLMHLSGVPMVSVPVYVGKAIREIAQDGRYWRIAKKQGVTESTYAAQELFRIERDILDIESRNAGKVSLATVKNVAAKLAEVAGDSYQFIEAVGKTARIIYAMEKEGKNAQEAAAIAQKWLFDYSLVPPAVRTARNMPVGVPFLTFYYKVLPRLLESVIKRPWSYLPYVALPYIMAMLFADQNDVSEEDALTLMNDYPQWLQDRGNAFLMPYRDEEGRWQAFDFGYILPWTMWTETAGHLAEGDLGEAVKNSGVFGGPIPSIATAIWTNTDPFTGRTIIAPGGTATDRMVNMLTYAYTMAAPTWLTNQGFAGKMLDAINEDVKLNEAMTGKTILTPGQATMRLFGANVYPFTPERSRMRNIEGMKKVAQEIKMASKKQIEDVRNDSNKTEYEKEVEIEKISVKMQERVQKEMLKVQEYADKSEVPDALSTP